MRYADSGSGKGWHPAERAGSMWLAFMIVAVVMAFCAVQIALTPALRQWKKLATASFIAAGVLTIIGAATAHTDNHSKGKHNNCVEFGKASASIMLAFLHGFGLFLAATFAALDLTPRFNDGQEHQPRTESRQQNTVSSNAQPAYNMESIDIPEEKVDVQVAEHIDDAKIR